MSIALDSDSPEHRRAVQGDAMPRRDVLKLFAAAVATGVVPESGSTALPGPPPQEVEPSPKPVAPAIEKDAVPKTPRGQQHKAIEPSLEDIRLKNGVNGIAVAAYDAGKYVNAELGLADAATKRPVTGETLFPVASLTKPVTAYVVLQLVLEGKLQLDVPLKKWYWPKGGLTSDAQSEAITARMVLSHTSGLPLDHQPKWPVKAEFAPGAAFGYSGAAFRFLQQVIEQVEDKPLDLVVQERVVKPLGLGSGTCMTWTSPHCDNLVATGYENDGSPVQKSNQSRPTKPSGAASLHITALDYLRFTVNAFLAAPRTDPPELTRLYRSMAIAPHVPITEDIGWGLGWAVRVMKTDHRFWHWGDSRGFTSYACASVTTGSALVITTNSRNGLAAACQIAVATLGEEERGTFQWLLEENRRINGRR